MIWQNIKRKSVKSLGKNQNDPILDLQGPIPYAYYEKTLPSAKEAALRVDVAGHALRCANAQLWERLVLNMPSMSGLYLTTQTGYTD